jgi:L-ribulose-5-phosphate 4-epimerase
LRLIREEIAVIWISGWRHRMDKNVDVLKEKLARACRMLEMIGLIGYSGHISGRIPETETFFIHPQQLSRTEVTPGTMAEVTLQGEWVGGEMKPPSESPIHAAVYQARRDVNSVVHIHPHYAVIPSIAGLDLVPVSQAGTMFGPVVPVYPDAEKISDFKRAHDIAKALGQSRAIILKGHGAVVVESTVEGAFGGSVRLEQNARFFVEAASLAKPIPLSEEERVRAFKAFMTSGFQKAWDYYIEKGRKAGIFWD